MNWEIEYYKKENGDIPVLEYLLGIDAKLRAKAYSEIKLLQEHGIYLREPYVKPIKGKNIQNLFELRVKFSSDISRIFYFLFKENRFVLLSGFTKKTQRTPIKEIEKALKYKRDYEGRCKNE